MTTTAATAAAPGGGGATSVLHGRGAQLVQATAGDLPFTTPSKPPTASTFSFRAPALPYKQRRGSLALPSSPRVVEGHTFRDDTGLNALHVEGALSAPLPKRIRKFDPSADESEALSPSSSTPEKPEKKARKKWTEGETKMLVAGCNKHGVGNWKTILRDPTLQFDNRSPVDLKDRFRTYYPDAYKLYYPNAKTHLSSKVRSTLPDGTPLFEKSRSKRRRPFTEEEDRALKEGYEKYGTVWATIVKEYPVFREQNRRSTDLRDRFRNAFPELYQLAGYKPRNAAKKKTAVESPTVTKRAATDDQLGTTSTGGPVRSRKRAHTNQGLLRGGTKSVPQSTACTEDEDSSAGEEEEQMSPVFKLPQTPVLSDAPSPPTKKFTDHLMPYETVEDEEMDMITLDPLAEALALPDLLSNHENPSHAWSSGVSTPTHSNHWSTAAGSPTSSHLSSDMLMNAGSHPSPFLQRRADSLNGNNNLGMIGKSAWGTDWFSPNPRLDPSSNGVGSSSSYLDHHSRASPFSFHQLNQNVLDRYDLFPTSMPSDFSSEVGVGDSHSTFSDELFQPSGFRGFTHHSSYAGDLIFGARSHQQQSFLPSSSNNSGFGFGSLGLTGLSAVPQNAGIHPMQLHTPSILSGIDEAGIGGLVLDDRSNTASAGGQQSADPLGIPLPPESMDEDLREDVAMGDVGRGSPQGMQRSPSKLQEKDQGGQAQQLQLQQDQLQPQQRKDVEASKTPSVMLEPFSLDDLVDLSNELHTTPPATPLTHPRPLRRSSGSMLHQFPSPGSLHARSVSVPPSEFRNSGVVQNGSIAALIDYEGSGNLQRMMILGGGGGPASQVELAGLVGLRGMGMFQQPSISQQLSQAEQESVGVVQQQQQMSNVAGGRQGSAIPTSRSGESALADDDEDDEDGNGETDPRPQTPTLASRHLLSLPSPITPSLSSSSSCSQSPVTDDLWKPLYSGANLGSELYNLPFLDLHYYGHGALAGGSTGGGMGSVATLHGMLHHGVIGSGGGGGEEIGFMDAAGQMQQAQALDLAATIGAGSVAVGGLRGLKSIDASSFGNFLGKSQQQQLSHLHSGQQQQQVQQTAVGANTGFMQDFEDRQQGHSPHGLRHPSTTTLRGGATRQDTVASQGGMGGIFKQLPSGMMGRSQSHHRGQSAVNPQDLMMRSDNHKRKRASWDGRQV